MSADGVQCELERLLVVDDEGPILHALQRTFEAAGYEVTACLDPAEALERLKEKAYQVLSADYMMPGMTGAEFLARARALQPETIRILITAAHDRDGIAVARHWQDRRTRCRAAQAGAARPGGVGRDARASAARLGAPPAHRVPARGERDRTATPGALRRQRVPGGPARRIDR